MNNYQDANAETQQEYFGNPTITRVECEPKATKQLMYPSDYIQHIAKTARIITAEEIKAMIQEHLVIGDESTITIRRSIFNKIDQRIKATLDE